MDLFVQGQPPATQPLLVYNCAKLPSICRNVNQRNPLLPVVGNFPGLLAPGNLGPLNTGNTPGGLDYLQLTYDTKVISNLRERCCCHGYISQYVSGR